MHVATAQLPGIEDSDDKIYTTPNAVIMLDGASAFVPVPVAASTYAAHLGQQLRGALEAQPHAELSAVLGKAIGDTAHTLQLQPGESPSSTVTVARQTGDHIDLLMLGDNLVITPDGTLTDDRMDALDLAPRRQYRERLSAGSGYDEQHKAILRELQTEQAHHRNHEGGYWIAEADPFAAEHAVTTQRPHSTTPWLVLVTDGAYNTLRHLGHAGGDTLASADQTQLVDLLATCQQWEADKDPHGQSLPRSKRHDDKSIASISF